MIDEKEIVFVTTSCDDFLLKKQQEIITKLFPNSDKIVVTEGSWPYKWFNWIPLMKGRTEKYFIHLDIDFFITSKEEVLRSVQILESNSFSLYGVSDGYDPHRACNPVALNSYYMVGSVSDLNELNFNPNILEFSIDSDAWKNNLNLYFKESYLNTFFYPHEISEDERMRRVKEKIQWPTFHYYNQEPYYILFWIMLNRGKKIGYLDSRFDDRFKSSNPRIDKNSDDIGIHMWYSRSWQSEVEIRGMKNIDRYKKIMEYLCI